MEPELFIFLSRFSCPAALIQEGERRVLINAAMADSAKLESDTKELALADFIHLRLRLAEQLAIDPLAIDLREHNGLKQQVVLFSDGIGEQLHYLAEERDRLKSVNLQKSEFIGIVAHDLRAPLHRLGLMLEVVENPNVTPEKKKKFSGIFKQTIGEMRDLLNDLLDVNRLESGKLALRLEDFDLHSFLSDIVEVQNFSAEKKRIRVLESYEAQVSAVHLDREKLAQVLNNLIGNAVKFSPPDSDITLHTGSTESELLIEVLDRGPGVPENERDSLFQPFKRGTNKPTAGEPSTGLGLVIAKKMLEVQGATIEYESRHGGGSIFRCRIPRPA